MRPIPSIHESTVLETFVTHCLDPKPRAQPLRHAPPERLAERLTELPLQADPAGLAGALSATPGRQQPALAFDGCHRQVSHSDRAATDAAREGFIAAPRGRPQTIAERIARNRRIEAEGFSEPRFDQLGRLGGLRQLSPAEPVGQPEVRASLNKGLAA